MKYLRPLFYALPILALSLLLVPQNQQINATSTYQNGRIEISESYRLRHKVTAANLFKSAVYEASGEFNSGEIETEFKFNGLIVGWKENIPEGTEAEIEINIKDRNGWSGWHHLHGDHDAPTGIIEENGFILRDTMVFANEGQSFKYRIEKSTENSSITPEIKDLNFEYIRSEGQGPVVSATEVASLNLPYSEKGIIPRSQWGATEEFGYKSYHEEKKITYAKSSGSSKPLPKSEVVVVSKVTHDPSTEEELLWPMEYPDRINKIIVHHTATTKDLDTPLVALRNVYYYHAVRKGWGDIGYNYLIDKYGNVYEGRRGGESVAGGHAYGYNRGTIGIALLGDFEDEQPTFEMMASLIKLSKDLSDKYGIDPQGVSEFNEIVIPNISGHYEVSSTRCPGGKMKSFLPAVRRIAAKVGRTSTDGRLPSSSEDRYSFEIATRYDAVFLEANEEKQIQIQLRNTGTMSWGKETFLIADQNGDNNGSVFFPDKYTISKQHEGIVRPGEVGTYSLKLRGGIKPDFLAFDLTLIFDGDHKTEKYIGLPVYVNAPNMSFIQENSVSFNNSYEPGDKIEVVYKVLNNGTVAWTKAGEAQVKLIFDEPLWHQSALLPSGQLVASELEEDQVSPGQVGTFKVTLTAPNVGGHIFEKLAIYNDTYGKLSGSLSPISFTVGSINELPEAELISMAPQTTFDPSETKVITFKLRNTGFGTWSRIGDDSVTVVSINNPSIKVSEEFTFNEGQVETGQVATFSVPVTAPSEDGNYTVIFVPWYKGVRLFEKPIYFYFQVGSGEVLVDSSTTPFSSEPAVKRKARSSNTNEKMRIKLSFNKQSPLISSSSDFRLYDKTGNSMQFEAGSQVEIKKHQKGRFSLKHGDSQVVLDGPLRIKSVGGIMEVVNLEKRPGWNPSLNDNIFRGIIEVRDYKDELVIINELPLEEYVKGIGEVSNGDHQEKIKTIMVLARTYAQYYRDLDEKFPGAPYHLDDNPDVSQKYLGYGLELRAPNMVSAVDATSGEVVTYDGILVKTPYFNTSDGRTRSAQEVWGWTHTPYLQSVEDPLCTEGVLRGHGVGLSGCGATEAAKIGKTYKEIIKYYYQGVEVEVKR